MEYRVKHQGLVTTLKHLISFPFIWAPLLPMLLLHLFIEIYHRIAFPLYGLDYVNIKKYIRFDRSKLGYIMWTEKIGCLYCSYMNGILAYFVEIAGRTERYWCGIKHKEDSVFVEPIHQQAFANYNDLQDFYQKYKKTSLTRAKK